MKPRAQVRLASELIHYNHNFPSVITRRALAVLSARKAIPVQLRRAMGKLAEPGLEPNLRPFLKISSDKAFVDVGANIGSFTMYFAPRCKRVYAFEPFPPTFHKLVANTQLYPNVVAFNAALGEREEVLPLFLHGVSGHNSLVRAESDFSGEVHATRVHRMDNLDLRDIGIIKIDTEGYEGSVVRGALQTIAREKPRIVVEVHAPYPENEASVVNAVRRYRWRRSWRSASSQFFLIGDPVS